MDILYLIYLILFRDLIQGLFDPYHYLYTNVLVFRSLINQKLVSNFGCEFVSPILGFFRVSSPPIGYDSVSGIVAIVVLNLAQGIGFHFIK